MILNGDDEVGLGPWACDVETWFRVGPTPEGWDMRVVRYRFASKAEAEAKREEVLTVARAARSERTIFAYRPERIEP